MAFDQEGGKSTQGGQWPEIALFLLGFSDYKLPTDQIQVSAVQSDFETYAPKLVHQKVLVGNVVWGSLLLKGNQRIFSKESL